MKAKTKIAEQVRLYEMILSTSGEKLDKQVIKIRKLLGISKTQATDEELYKALLKWIAQMCNNIVDIPEIELHYKHGLADFEFLVKEERSKKDGDNTST